MEEAIRAYTDVIAGSPSDVVALCNRSAAHLKNGDATRALEDAAAAARLDADYPFSLFRAGNALCALGRTTEAVSVFESLLRNRAAADKFSAKQKQLLFRTLRKASTALAEEQRRGKYDTAFLLLAPRPPACADFISAKVAVQKVPRAGRGLVATQDIAEGELILAENPVALVRTGADDGIVVASSSVLSAEQGHTVERLYGALVSAIQGAVSSDAQKRAKVAVLTDGGDEEALRVPLVGEFLPPPPAAADANASAEGAARPPLPPSDGAPALSADTIRGIMMHNAFVFTPAEDLGRSAEEARGFGLWPFAAMLNHSCAPNASRVFVQNGVMLCRASRAIAAGEQICWPYFDIFQPDERRAAKAREWGFECACRRCAGSCATRASTMAAAEAAEILGLAPGAGDAADAADAAEAPGGPADAARNVQVLEGALEAALAKAGASEGKDRWARASFVGYYIDCSLRLLSAAAARKSPLDDWGAGVVEETLRVLTAADPAHPQVRILCTVGHGAAAAGAGDVPLWEERTRQAHRVRYGALDEGGMQEMMQHTAQGVSRIGRG